MAIKNTKLDLVIAGGELVEAIRSTFTVEDFERLEDVGMAFDRFVEVLNKATEELHAEGFVEVGK